MTTVETTFSNRNKTKLKKRLVYLTNQLLKICTYDSKSEFDQCIPRNIQKCEQINSDLFVFIYENVCGNKLIDKKWPIKCFEDEIHNVQAVIDSLSLDILHEDLSHLTGEAICGVAALSHTKHLKRDYVSIEYLLDILTSIKDWIDTKNKTEDFELNEEKNDEQINSTENLSNSICSNESSLNLIEEVENDYQKQIKLANCENKSETKNLKKQVNDEENDLFKNYMREMENKFMSSILNKEDDEFSENINEVVIINNKNNLLDRGRNMQKSRSNSNSPSPILLNNKIQSNKTENQKFNHIQTIKNELKYINSNIKMNTNKETKIINNLMKSIYKDDLEDAKTIHKQSLHKLTKNSQLTDQLYKNACEMEQKSWKNHLNNRLKIRQTAVHKGFLLPKKIIKRSSSVCSTNRSSFRSSLASSRRRHSSQSNNGNYLSRVIIGENGILNMLLDEFPYLYTSPETIHYLWQTHSRQIELLARRQKEIENKYITSGISNLIIDETNDQKRDSSTGQKSKAQIHLRESFQKQEVLMDIMRKDLKHIERVQDMKKLKQLENAMKAKQREQRFQNARSKRYYEEMCLKKKARMLKQATSEELVFKKLFNETIKLQKERLLELKNYAKEKNDVISQKQLNEIESIENHYKTKFELMNEKMQAEKNDSILRQQSQHRLLNKLKTQYKEKLESQIMDLQEQMCRDKDFIHWRELDAEQLKKEIQRASYFNK